MTQTNTSDQRARIEPIDFLRGLVMILMALDHVRMYFAIGAWYSEPTNLATTTPLLFFTRWITHFWRALLRIFIETEEETSKKQLCSFSRADSG